MGDVRGFMKFRREHHTNERHAQPARQPVKVKRKAAASRGRPGIPSHSVRHVVRTMSQVELAEILGPHFLEVRLELLGRQIVLAVLGLRPGERHALPRARRLVRILDRDLR